MAEPSIKDLAYRTAASVFGGPVDLASMVMRPFGYKTPDEQVFGGSEYIGKKMEDVGLVSSARSPLTEFIASVAVPTPGGIAKGAALAAPLIGGMFVGKGAKTWDALAAAKAKMLADMGTDARTIWKETGTWKGPDGKWRQEIDDSAASIKDFGKNKDEAMLTALEHKQLFNAYPAQAYTRARITSQTNLPPHLQKTLIGKGEGSYSYTGYNGEPLIEATAYSPKDTSVILHELQHAVQQKEGFAKGGSPQGPYAKGERDFLIKQNVLKRLSPIDQTNPYANSAYRETPEEALLSATQYVDSESGRYDAYRRFAGEAEARATQARMNMTPEQRRAMFPEESYDVPINELIIRDVVND